MNRQIHRWTSLPIAIIMLIVAVSGIYLQALEFGGHDDVRASGVVLPDEAEMAALVTRAIMEAKAVKPDHRIEKIEINLGKKSPGVALIAPGGRRAAKIEYDDAMGVAKFAPPPKASLRGIMIQLHTGRMGSNLGLVLVMLSGLILTILSITGLVVYYDMWKRRSKAGKTGLFWK